MAQAKASIDASSNVRAFEALETFCMFIGYPRSGHTLIGSLLDAHPNVIIAHKLNALKYVKKAITAPQLYPLLLENSQSSVQNGRTAGKTVVYSYAVLNQWQGRFKELRVIGDKKGGGTTERLRSHPELLNRLEEMMPLKIKFIHVTRNPYDNISTISKRKGLNLDDSTNFYFSLCETNQGLKRQIADEDLFELRHESFIEHPQALLKELCQFLGQDSTDDYLNDCAGIVHKSPHQSRHEIQWDPGSIDVVKKRIAEFDFLKGYSFEC